MVRIRDVMLSRHAVPNRLAREAYVTPQHWYESIMAGDDIFQALTTTRVNFCCAMKTWSPSRQARTTYVDCFGLMQNPMLFPSIGEDNYERCRSPSAATNRGPKRPEEHEPILDRALAQHPRTRPYGERHPYPRKACGILRGTGYELLPPAKTNRPVSQGFKLFAATCPRSGWGPRCDVLAQPAGRNRTLALAYWLVSNLPPQTLGDMVNQILRTNVFEWGVAAHCIGGTRTDGRGLAGAGPTVEGQISMAHNGSPTLPNFLIIGPPSGHHQPAQLSRAASADPYVEA
jgi:hypothetical protein